MAMSGHSDGCPGTPALTPKSDILSPISGLPPITSATPPTPDVSGGSSSCSQLTLRFRSRKGSDPLGMALHIMCKPISSSQILSPCYTCNISTPTVQVRSVHLLYGGVYHSAASLSSTEPPAPCRFVRASP